MTNGNPALVVLRDAKPGGGGGGRVVGLRESKPVGKVVGLRDGRPGPYTG